MELQAQLEQARQDKKLAIGTADKEIQRIKTLIADSEVTYSVGDRFKDDEGEKTILVSSLTMEVVMACLKNGNRYGDSTPVSSWREIPQAEFLAKFGERNTFTRYWDARKKCKC